MFYKDLKFKISKFMDNYQARQRPNFLMCGVGGRVRRPMQYLLQFSTQGVILPKQLGEKLAPKLVCFVLYYCETALRQEVKKTHTLHLKKKEKKGKKEVLTLSVYVHQYYQQCYDSLHRRHDRVLQCCVVPLAWRFLYCINILIKQLWPVTFLTNCLA